MAKKSFISRYLWLLPFISFLAGYWLMSVWYRPKVLQTPSLLGKTIHEALRMVTDKNINLRLLEEREVVDLPEGTILQQNPPAGLPIKPYQSIFCVVSKKSAKTVPAIVGKNLQESVKHLDEQGILYKQYLLESSQLEGMCIAQDPLPEAPLPQSALLLYGAKSVEKPVIVPLFIYLTIPAVMRFLETAPVTVDIMHTTAVPEGHRCDQHCIITDQRPRAGTIVTLDLQKPLHIQLSVG